MKKIVDTLINESVKGVDTYSHNGSTWLIFTDTKQWVIELTESKTLWYNYNFFKGMFAYVSMDVVENQSYITQWVEDNIIGGGAKETQFNFYEKQLKIEGVIKNGSIDSVRVNEYSLNYVSKQRDCEDTIENGVKETHRCSQISDRLLEDTIQNGVKNIMPGNPNHFGLEDTVQNGIKETRLEMNITEGEVDDIIQDGVKHTARNNACADWEIEDTIQNGVIYTFGDNHHKHHFVDNIIQNGVIDTQSNPYENKSWIEGVIKKGVKKTKMCNSFSPHEAEDVIENGVKETKSIGKESPNYPIPVINHIIKNGVKETNPVDVMGFFNNKMEDALQNGVKETLVSGSWNNDKMDEVIENGKLVSGTFVGDVIDKGVKETHDDVYHHKGRIDGVIKNGVKETQPLPEQSGELRGYGDYYDLKEDRTKAFIDYLEETIKFGVKEVYWLPKEHKQIDSNVNPIDDVINNGVKKVSKGGITQLSKINEVIQNGVTNTYPDYMPNEYDWNEDFNVDKVIDEGTLI